MALRRGKKRKYHWDGTLSDGKVVPHQDIVSSLRAQMSETLLHVQVCKNNRDLFLNIVSYNCFVEVEQKVAVPFIPLVKKCCMGVCGNLFRR